MVILLAALSLVILYSLNLNQANPDFFKFKRQLLSVGIGFVCLLIFLLIDYRFVEDYAYLFYFISLLLLILVLFFGTNLRGTTGWFILGPISFQPIELAKIFLLLSLAKFFEKRTADFKNIALSGIMIGLPSVLLLLQPDTGYVILSVIWWLGFLITAGMQKKYLILIVILMIVSAACAWLFFLHNYQKERILVFLQPQRDILGSGYNIQQSIIAVGSGKLAGQGLGIGPQSRLNFLPEQDTDFIFSVISEEMGFLGASFTLGLLAFLIFKILAQAKNSVDNFEKLLLTGIGFFLLTQTSINIAMVIGLAPVIGIPLPFLSYGGNSLISNLIIIGLVESILIHRP